MDLAEVPTEPAATARHPGARRRVSHPTLLLAATAIAIAMAIAEFACRHLLPRPGFHGHSPDELAGLFVPHPGRDFAYAPNFTGRVARGARVFTVSTNALGLRSAPLAASDTGGILAIGDSFTAGWGVDAEETWPARLEAELRASAPGGAPPRVVNAGVSGYSLRQMRRAAAELVPVIKPRLVVAGVFIGGADRVEDPYVLVGGEVVRRSRVESVRVVPGGYIQSEVYRPSLRALDFWLMEHCYSCAWVFHGTYALSGTLRRLPERLRGPRARGITMIDEVVRARVRPLLAELDSLERLTRERGVPLVVMPINEQLPDGRFEPGAARADSLVATFCRARGVVVFDPLPALAAAARGAPIFRMGTDLHWSPAAHALVARELAAYLGRTGVLEHAGRASPQNESSTAESIDATGGRRRRGTPS